MLAGHWAASFVAKGVAPRAPLAVLLVAAQLVDVGWSLLVLAGVERVSIDPALTSNTLVLEHMPWTHSLPAACVWSLAAALGARSFGASRRVAAVVGATVGSHWLADWLVHRPDLLLFPGGPKVGLAIWDHPAAALALEIGLVLASAAFCTRMSGFSGSARRALWAFAASLVVVQLTSAAGAAPRTSTSVAVSALALFGTVALAGVRIERRFLSRSQRES